jgi:hypothetical protein
MYADNARSILCTLVGSEAAIVAIVVSLTLIAIELTASVYSPRVIKIALWNPDMWLLLLIYGVAIFSSIIIIKQLPYESRFPTEDVSFAFWFGVFSYAALAPYLLNIIQFLHPTNIVRRLSEEIADDDIVKYINGQEKTSKGDETIPTEDSNQSAVDGVNENRRTNGDTHDVGDPIQRILDIIYRSINNYDLETVREGLVVILKHAKKVIGSSKEKEKSISKYFCNQLKRIGRLAASKDDEGSTKEVIKNLETFGEYTAEAKRNAATEQVAVTLGAVGKISVAKGEAFEEAVNLVASSLGAVGKAAAGKGLEEATKEVAFSLSAFGKAAAVKGFKAATSGAISSLEVVGATAAENKLKDATKDVASALGEVGVTAAVKGKELEDAVIQTAKSLEKVGEVAADKGKELRGAIAQIATVLKDIGIKAAGKGEELKEAALQTVLSLEGIGRTTAGKGGALKEATWKTVLSLKEVGTTAVDNGKDLEVVIEQVALSLGFIGVDVAKKGEELEVVIEQVALSLGSIGKDAANKELEKAGKQVASSLLDVGIAIVEIKELKETTKKTAKSLAELKILSKKKIVETTISEYKKRSDGVSFQEFIRLYGEEIKEMNANASE